MADEKVIWQMLARYGIKDIKELAEAIRRLEPIDLGFATKGGVYDDSESTKHRRERSGEKTDG